MAIVENDEFDAATLKKYVQQYGSEFGDAIETTIFGSGALFLRDYSPKYDLVFMDIEMPGMNGMETAKELRNVDTIVKLIFVTNMANYALQGYAVGALDYILKPIRYPDICMRMERIRQMLTYGDKKITIPFQGGVKILQPQEIIYVESYSHQITFHTTSGDFSTRKSMNYWEETLMNLGFARCSTSYIVNLKYCREVDGYLLKIENKEIQISRARKKDFMKLLMRTL